MASGNYLTAQEAATALGVSLTTLYAYVSRGLVRSEAVGKTRSRRYHLEDILALQERREQRKNPQKIVEGALQLGAPLMESALTLIADGRLYYRGRDVLELAQTRTAEQVAWLLWTGQMTSSEQFTALPALSPKVGAARRAVAGLMPVEVFQVLLPLAAVDDLAAFDLRPAAVVQSGMRILRLLAALAVGGRPSAAGVAETLQRGWVPDDEAARAGLNTALILCADHEFNVSAFTARCVASAGSTPYAVVSAGLAALQGTRHGGHTVRVEALFDEVREPQRAREAIVDRLRRGEGISGFEQQLYPAGDPRGAALVRLATDLRPQSREVELASAVIAAVQEVTGERPTVDFGLAMLARALRLPPGAALALFAIGRSIGWIGHAIEQYQQDHVIRPRARYIGEPPRSP
jgi:citrate synthase